MTKPKVYIESSCFIDMAKQAVGILPKDRDADVWFCKKLLEAHRDGKIEILTALLTIAECQHADSICDDKVQGLFRSILTSGQFVHLVQDTIDIALRARDLRWVHKLCFRGGDATHIASALENKCDELISTDGHFLDRNKEATKLGICLIRPHETARLPEEYLAGFLPGISTYAKGEIKKENTVKAISGIIDSPTDKAKIETQEKDKNERKPEENKKEEPPSKTEEKK